MLSVPTKMSWAIMVSRDGVPGMLELFTMGRFSLKFKKISSVGFSASVGRVLEASRVSVAWIPVGICMGALEKTYEYVAERHAFNAPLSSYQLIQGKAEIVSI